jgi:hypothetical protein
MEHNRSLISPLVDPVLGHGPAGLQAEDFHENRFLVLPWKLSGLQFMTVHVSNRSLVYCLVTLLTMTRWSVSRRIQGVLLTVCVLLGMMHARYSILPPPDDDHHPCQ